ncbi:MAG TPA: hypothetical protein EYG03_04135 [Planctomycetes bacterium]|nr:hypothetical protein [Fuerstiella sp.]HIK91167.1 hypothetical protein [Planctomycetota bacterium]
MATNTSRREFVKHAAGLLAMATLNRNGSAADELRFPTRFITTGPRHHWFGYYDKLQFDPTNRYVLGMEVPFEHRSPKADDVIQIGMIDLQDNDRWISLGESRAWNWQQGCMLQWLPGTESTVLWNDRDGDRFVCRILDVRTNESRTLPHPVYSVSPDGKSAVTPDFRRIADVRPGYGYTGLPDPFGGDLAPSDTGVFHVDLATGESKLILSLKEISATGDIPNAEVGIKHYFNHLLFSPDGSRFIALHRWQYPNGKRLTRLITAKPDGTDLRIVIPNGYASHFIWRDPQHILSQSKELLGNANWGDFLFEDREGGRVKEIGHGVLDPSGHLSYLPGNEWILNDTYPKGPERLQTPHVYHVATGKRIDLADFHLPKSYVGEWRVDTHPRLSRDGRTVCIDAVDGTNGRQLALIDISSVVT